LIPVVVSERVVDLLEAIEVHEHHCDQRSIALGGLDRLIQAIVEQSAVREIRERVV
jgi:hypothetical protein